MSKLMFQKGEIEYRAKTNQNVVFLHRYVFQQNILAIHHCCRE